MTRAEPHDSDAIARIIERAVRVPGDGGELARKVAKAGIQEGWSSAADYLEKLADDRATIELIARQPATALLAIVKKLREGASA